MITMHDLNIGRMDFEFCRDFNSNFLDQAGPMNLFEMSIFFIFCSVFTISNGETIQDHCINIDYSSLFCSLYLYNNILQIIYLCPALSIQLQLKPIKQPHVLLCSHLLLVTLSNCVISKSQSASFTRRFCIFPGS